MLDDKYIKCDRLTLYMLYMSEYVSFYECFAVLPSLGTGYWLQLPGYLDRFQIPPDLGE